MPYDYSAWPTLANLNERLAALNASLGASITDDLKEGILDSLVQEIERETRRQFVPSQGTRYFDGSGTGEQPVDEYVEISDVRIYAYLGIPSAVLISSWAEVERSLYPKDRIYIARGSLPSFAPVWLDVFPEGRRNVEVTGTWGFAAEIPADLWNALLDAAAARVLTLSLTPSNGRMLKGWQEKDSSQSYAIALPEEVTGAGARLQDAIGRYSRNPSRMGGANRRRMV